MSVPAVRRDLVAGPLTARGPVTSVVTGELFRNVTEADDDHSGDEVGAGLTLRAVREWGRDRPLLLASTGLP